MGKRISQLILASLLALSLSPAQADVQNQDYSVRQIEALGTGADAETAMQNAEVTALEQVAATLVQTEQEKAAWQKVRAQIIQNRAQYVAVEKIVGKGSTDDGRYYKILFNVNVGQLRKDLVAAKVIASTQDLSRQLNFPKIMAYFKNPGDTSDYAIWSVGRVNDYLIKSDFKVVDAKIMAQLSKDDQLIAQSSGQAPRLNQAIALKAQADIYMSVAIAPKIAGKSGEYTYVQTPVQVQAFESSSGVPFITKTYQRLDRNGNPEALALKGSVDVSTKAVIEEAVAGVMPQITEDLLRHWKGNVARGKQFILVFKGLGGNKVAALEAALKQKCSEAVSKGNGQYVIRYQGVLGDLADALEGELGSSLGLTLDKFDLGSAYFTVR